MADQPRVYENGVPVDHPRGRPKGTKNRYGKDLRALILQAMEETGRDGSGTEGVLGYLKWAALAQPEQFIGLVKASMPKEVNFAVESDTLRLLSRFLGDADLRRSKLIEMKRRFDEEGRAIAELEEEVGA